jgi:hypothetical protein
MSDDTGVPRIDQQAATGSPPSDGGQRSAARSTQQTVGHDTADHARHLWSAFWRIDPRPDGRPAPDGPLVEAVEDKYEHIAAGQAVAILPASARHHLRPDLTAIPLEGVEPSRVVLASRAGDDNALVAAFRAAVTAHHAA